MDVLALTTPCTIGGFGCQQSGKTTFVKRLLESNVFTETPSAILYCYMVNQPIFEAMEKHIPNFSSQKGLPSEEDIEMFTKSGKHTILILDDLMSQVSNSPHAEELFTVHSHHRNMSIIYLSQNIFYSGKKSKTISLQLHYLVLFRNPRDHSQIVTLSRQLFPGKAQGFLEIYEDALSQPYSYLLIDISPHTDPKYRLRTNIFPDEDPIVYRLL